MPRTVLTRHPEERNLVGNEKKISGDPSRMSLVSVFVLLLCVAWIYLLFKVNTRRRLGSCCSRNNNVQRALDRIEKNWEL